MDMKKKCIVILVLLILGTIVFGSEYYICLGSFIKEENLVRFAKKLNQNGIATRYEKVAIKAGRFTRVLYYDMFTDYKEAVRKQKELAVNRILIDEGIRDIWIRPGKIRNPYTPDLSVETEELSSTRTPERSDEMEYKGADSYEYEKCIFSTTPIVIGAESESEIKTVFVSPEKVYARAYFPGPVGNVGKNDFWHEIWVDGKMHKRTFFTEGIDSTWDQIQIWITEDEYSAVMSELSPGQHEIVIWVIKNEYQGEKVVTETNAAGEMEKKMKEIWVPKKMSKGKFVYIVK